MVRIELYRQIRPCCPTGSRDRDRCPSDFCWIPPSEGDITNVVQNALTNAGWDPTKVAGTSVTVTGAGGPTGNDLTVQLDVDHTFFVISNLIPSISDPYPLSASTTMKRE